MSSNEIRGSNAASRNAAVSQNGSARAPGKENAGNAFAQMLAGASGDDAVRGVEPVAPTGDAAGNRRSEGVRASDNAPAAQDEPRHDADAPRPTADRATAGPVEGKPRAAAARNASAADARPAEPARTGTAQADDGAAGNKTTDVATATATTASATTTTPPAGPDAALIAQLMAFAGARAGLPAATVAEPLAPRSPRPDGAAGIDASGVATSADTLGLGLGKLALPAGLLPSGRAASAANATDARAPASAPAGDASAALASATGLGLTAATPTSLAGTAPAATPLGDPARLAAELTELTRGGAATGTDRAPLPGFDAALAGASSLAASSVVATDTPTAVPQADLSAPVGSDAWGEQLASQVSRWTLDGIDVAELTLHPKDMGPIHVEIALVEGKAAVHFAAEQADTRAAIDQQMFRLGDSLAQSGITLQSGTSGFESQGQAFGFMREQPRDGSGGNRNGAGNARDDASQADATPVAAAPASRANRRALDLFA